MDLDVQWFNYFVLAREVITLQQSQDLFQEVGADADLLTFAQALVDSDLCDDVETIQALVDDAVAQGADGGPPPEVGADPLRVTEVSPEPAPAAETPEVRGDLASEPVASATVTRQMPAFDGVEELSDADVAELMGAVLTAARHAAASDLHISAGAPPFIRRYAQMQLLADAPLSVDAALRLNTTLLDEAQRQLFLDRKDANLALELADKQRYRVNLVVHKDGSAGTYHIVPGEIRSLADLGFSNHETIVKLLDHHNGLIMVTGPAGSGKTTTLAALVNAINRKRSDHIITIEDPIEILHTSLTCFVTQRQVGAHTDSYASALKGALREDPDIVIIGELHDLETIEMAITAAETGHLVISTLHTRDAASTLNRLLDVFPPSQQQQIRAMTAESLRAIICQQLLPRADADGLVLANELFVNTAAGAKIIREGRTHHLQGVMQTGIKQGMQSMDHSVLELCNNGLISEDVARPRIKSREMLRRLETAGVAADDPAAGEKTATGGRKKKRKYF